MSETVGFGMSVSAASSPLIDLPAGGNTWDETVQVARTLGAAGAPPDRYRLGRHHAGPMWISEEAGRNAKIE